MLHQFLGDTVQDTFGRITGVTYDFDTEEFDNVSMDAKNFIKDLLLNKMESRMTAEECLHHPWMCSETGECLTILKTDNLRKFLARRRWQKGAQAVLALKRISVTTPVVVKPESEESNSDE